MHYRSWTCPRPQHSIIALFCTSPFCCGWKKYEVLCVTKAMLLHFCFFPPSLFFFTPPPVWSAFLPVPLFKPYQPKWWTGESPLPPAISIVQSVLLPSLCLFRAVLQPRRVEEGQVCKWDGAFHFPTWSCCWLHASASKGRQSWGRYLKWGGLQGGLITRHEAGVDVYRKGLCDWPSHNQQTPSASCLYVTLLHCNQMNF